MRLTDISVRQLKPPQSGAKVYPDDTLTGFGVRVSFQGTASFVLTYGNARKRITIGRVGIITLKDARAKAKSILAERTLGKGEVTVISFEDAFKKFQTSHLSQNKESTSKTTKRQITVHFLPKLRLDKVCNIPTADIAEILTGLAKTPAERVHAHAAIRLFFRWCEESGYVENSPVRRIKAPKVGTSRDRVLSDDELTKVASTALKGTTQFHKIVALLLLNGQRRKQIASLDRAWIGHNSQAFTFPKEIMKGNREHVLPYSDLTSTIVSTLPKEGLLFPGGDSGKPFSAFSKCKKAFDKECGVKKWTLHDLRRTMRTGFGKLKILPHIGERILDHRTGIVSEVEQIYDRWTYIDEMRAAMTAWENHVLGLLAKEKHGGDSMGQTTTLPHPVSAS